MNFPCMWNICLKYFALKKVVEQYVLPVFYHQVLEYTS